MNSASSSYVSSELRRAQVREGKCQSTSRCTSGYESSYGSESRSLGEPSHCTRADRFTPLCTSPVELSVTSCIIKTSMFEVATERPPALLFCTSIEAGDSARMPVKSTGTVAAMVTVTRKISTHGTAMAIRFKKSLEYSDVGSGCDKVSFSNLFWSR